MGARLRPEFEITTALTSAEVLARMQTRLKASECAICGLVTADRIELHVPSERQHLWSPELQVSVEPDAQGARLVGVYGPHPHVWTLYVGVYAGIVFAAFVASVFAFAQWTLGEEMVGLYVLPPLALLALAAHGLAFVGQGLGAAQMDELRSFLDEVLSEGAPSSVPLQSGVRATGPAGGLSRTG